MKTFRRVLLVAVAGSTLGLIISLGSQADGIEGPWIAWQADASGHVDLTRLPSSLPVLDCEGNEVGTIENPLDPSRDEEYVPPTPSGAAAVCDAGVGYDVPFTSPLDGDIDP